MNLFPRSLHRDMAAGLRTSAAGVALLLAGLVLQGCSQNAPPPPYGGGRVYAADVQGAAKACTVPKITPAPGQVTEAAVTVGNDGGWCGLVVFQPGPHPYAAGLLNQRPAHGTVLVHTVGDETRIDYTPDRGYTGPDSFNVMLLPGNATIHETVTVTAP